MTGAPVMPSWRETLSETSWLDALGQDFLTRYGDRQWSPNEADCVAAHLFRVELVSRVATRRLGYTQGVETSALRSMHALFERARDISRIDAAATTTETFVWHVLNVHVAPFTARWHSRSEAGLLRALDAGDEFREELSRVQDALRALDASLRLILARDGYMPSEDVGPDAAALERELTRSVAWRPMGMPAGTSKPGTTAALEEAAVRARQDGLDIPPREWAAGIALSGGGIRSATFATGVLAALARRNLLPQFDYLSTVSGGGYAGAFLTQLVSSAADDRIGLGRQQEPFLRSEGESAILKALRQKARYLTGSFWERVSVALRQAHGLYVNMLILVLVTGCLAFVETLVRPWISARSTAIFAFALPVLAVAIMALIGRWLEPVGEEPGRAQIAIGLLFLVPPLWYLLGATHLAWTGLAHLLSRHVTEGWVPLATASIVLVSALVIAVALITAFARLKNVTVAVATVIFALVMENVLYAVLLGMPLGWRVFAFVACALIGAASITFIDVNLTSLHRYYRAKLAAAFLVTPDGQSSAPVKLSDINTSRTPFPILNCAVNVPGSGSPSVRGRLSEVFSFTPVAAGSKLLGYDPTHEWERVNPDLDLATAMALSGAAVSPQMGLGTTRLAGFWLTLLNIRLGAWLKRPHKQGCARPRLLYLLHEFASTASEKLPFAHVSDGGHIENLGVYELLRRRCRYIVAVDGENDPSMTFHALTNLQRLAYIDFGIVLDIDLDDLRLGEGGLSRSHFRFCRIRYPGPADGEEEIGYLVYLKLSLTGNEGEFIRRYRHDEPEFPHHPTADQFFTEPQFEAYRALGEHIGEKLFLKAIVGAAGAPGDVDLEQWVKALGRATL
ncbi:patatin-like phospholipase family protein [Methylobacterium radiotolerans]|uniref:patatin-like phospholipase family protein n=1 Tax=Methylobacterium radiotolerans TaxID=31998 RepID=UPI00237F305C|nr:MULTISPECIES: patatin-like phospholipase family protein [Methylobacterium]MDE3749574.1 patatin-like phospholipase family protein [Methylobacterium radiotolerans]